VKGQLEEMTYQCAQLQNLADADHRYQFTSPGVSRVTLNVVQEDDERAKSTVSPRLACGKDAAERPPRPGSRGRTRPLPKRPDASPPLRLSTA
jgi:hypothetical protein